MFAVKEIINNFGEGYIIIYCICIVWLNIDYLRDHKNIKKGLEDLPSTSDDELEVNPGSLSVMFIRIIFEFIRRWII